jgi:hypothetical protein
MTWIVERAEANMLGRDRQRRKKICAIREIRSWDEF